MSSWQFGYIDRSGELVVPRTLRMAQRFEDGFAAAAPFDRDQFGILGPTGACLVEPVLDYLGARSNGALAVNVGGQWGDGRVNGGRWGVVTAEGLVIAPRWEDLGALGDGLMPFMEGGRWGYANLRGEIVIPPSFEWAGQFVDGHAPVAVGGRDRYLRPDGSFAMEASFERASSWSSGRGRVKVEGQWRLVDGQGEELSEGFDEIWPVVDGMAQVRRGDRVSFIGVDGRLLTPEWFDDARVWADGLAPVRRGNDWFFLRATGELLGPYAVAMTPNEGLARFVPRDGEVGFLDANGAVAIAPTFETAQGFTEGLAPVKREGKWTWVDREGREIAPPRFDHAGVFGRDGLAVVRVGTRFGLVDREGREVVAPRFDALDNMSGGLARAQQADWPSGPRTPPAAWVTTPAEGLAFRGFDDVGASDHVRAILCFEPTADEQTLARASRIYNLWKTAMEARADGANVIVGETWLVSYALALRLTNIPDPIPALHALVAELVAIGLPIKEAVFGAFRDDPSHPREWNMLSKVIPAVPHPDDPRGSWWFSTWDEYWDAVWSGDRPPASESLQHLRAGRWNPRTRTHVFDERIFSLHHPKVRIAYGVYQDQGMFAPPATIDTGRRDAVQAALDAALASTFDRSRIWVFPGNQQWRPPFVMDRDWKHAIEVIECRGRRGYYFALDAAPLLHDVGPEAFRYREPELMGALARVIEQTGLAPVILWQRFGDPLNLPSMAGAAHPMNPSFYLIELWEP